MSRAVRIYRDNFVYTINTPLCEKHAQWAWKTRSDYAYLDDCEPEVPCAHCTRERRLQFIRENNIHWQLLIGGVVRFESGDRIEFWARVKALKTNIQYLVREIWPDGTVHGGET